MAYLSRFFGMGHLNLAEDVAQDTLCRALETWPVHGLPDNPSEEDYFRRKTGAARPR